MIRLGIGVLLAATVGLTGCSGVGGSTIATTGAGPDDDTFVFQRAPENAIDDSVLGDTSTAGDQRVVTVYLRGGGNGVAATWSLTFSGALPDSLAKARGAALEKNDQAGLSFNQGIGKFKGETRGSRAGFRLLVKDGSMFNLKGRVRAAGDNDTTTIEPIELTGTARSRDEVFSTGRADGEVVIFLRISATKTEQAAQSVVATGVGATVPPSGVAGMPIGTGTGTGT